MTEKLASDHWVYGLSHDAEKLEFSFKLTGSETGRSTFEDPDSYEYVDVMSSRGLVVQARSMVDPTYNVLCDKLTWLAVPESMQPEQWYSPHAYTALGSDGQTQTLYISDAFARTSEMVMAAMFSFYDENGRFDEASRDFHANKLDELVAVMRGASFNDQLQTVLKKTDAHIKAPSAHSISCVTLSATGTMTAYDLMDDRLWETLATLNGASDNNNSSHAKHAKEQFIKAFNIHLNVAAADK